MLLQLTEINELFKSEISLGWSVATGLINVEHFFTSQSKRAKESKIGKVPRESALGESSTYDKGVKMAELRALAKCFILGRLFWH